MRYLILFSALLYALPTHAESTPASQISALMEYCISSIESKKNPADYAVEKKLAEFPPDQAIKFAPQGGRVFEISSDMGNAVLLTNKDYAGMCGIAVRKTNPHEFWKLTHETFSRETGFRLKREKREESQRITRKDFEKESPQGNIALFISVSDRPRDGGMQALLTLARVRPTTSP